MISGWAAAGIVVVAVSLDMFFRWLAFRHLESVAIDFAVFSCVYSAVEMLRDKTDNADHWVARFFVCLIVLILLVILHAVLRDRLEDRIDDLIGARRKLVHTDDEHAALDELRPVLKHLALLTFSEPTGWTAGIRGGKTKRRNEATAVANRLLPSLQLDQSELVLLGSDRHLAAVGFGVLGLVSLGAAVIPHSVFSQVGAWLNLGQ